MNRWLWVVCFAFAGYLWAVAVLLAHMHLVIP